MAPKAKKIIPATRKLKEERSAPNKMKGKLPPSF